MFVKSHNRPKSVTCSHMPFRTMATEVDRAPSNFKFKITSRGIRAESEDESRGNTSKGLLKNGQKVNRISENGNNRTKLNINPSVPANPGKRKAEVSIDGQTGKKRRMDGILKYHCGNILKKLLSHQKSYIFSEPVDLVKWNIPDYFSIINEPMDLGTIKCKLDCNMYLSVEEFAADVKLTFSNATMYNPPGNHVHELAKEMEGCFSKRWKSLGMWLKQRNSDDEKGTFVHHVENNGRVTKPYVEDHHQGGKWIGLSQKKSGHAPDEESLLNLRTEVNAADATCGKVRPPRIALKVCSSLRAVQKEPCCRRSSVPAKQSQSIDSARAKCSSCASLTCHYRLKDGPTQASKSYISLEGSSENNRHSDSKPYREVKRTRSSSSLESDGHGVFIHEEKSPDLPNPATVVPPSSAEGWVSLHALMSPNKALRAAMLKSRFADTIFRATHQVEKVDPRKMQQERERLERETREEKARIEAGIIAAVAASQREQDELKKKRKRERATARMTLQKMEKSVEINESSGILKDVEMLCFGFQAGKTLERLGLYLKEDYLGEEDEDAILNAEEGESFS